MRVNILATLCVYTFRPKRPGSNSYPTRRYVFFGGAQPQHPRARALGPLRGWCFRQKGGFSFHLGCETKTEGEAPWKRMPLHQSHRTGPRPSFSKAFPICRLHQFFSTRSHEILSCPDKLSCLPAGIKEPLRFRRGSVVNLFNAKCSRGLQVLTYLSVLWSSYENLHVV